ncbi:MAG: response regulator transcription factor [bacterium]|nr:response regulator transcription factor [bacterium]
MHRAETGEAFAKAAIIRFGRPVMTSDRTRIILADDHPFILLALRQLVMAAADFEVVGEATTGLEALSMVRSTTPDVAVIDVGMPRMNGIMLARKIREEQPSVKVLILTAHEDEAHLKQALAAGASGFVVKRSATTTLIPAIRAAITGGTFVDPLVSGRLNGSMPDASIGADELSPREREVLKLTALGYATKEIADLMAIGGKSVETYRSRASEKLGLKSRADIVRFALSEGWLA